MAPKASTESELDEAMARLGENMVKHGRFMAFLEEQVADILENIPPSARGSNGQHRPHDATVSEHDQILDNASDEPSASFSLATDPEKRDLIGRYAEPFYKHFRQFKDPLERMVYVNTQIRSCARFDRRYTNIAAMHMDYYLMLPQYLAHTWDVFDRVHFELEKFILVQDYWWPKCVNLPTQTEREELVEAVAERLKCKDFDVTAFQAEYKEFYSTDYGEGFLAILQTWKSQRTSRIFTKEGEEVLLT